MHTRSRVLRPHSALTTRKVVRIHPRRAEIVARHNVNVIGRGTPVVFAHGFGTDQSTWAHQVEAFSDTHQLVLFDHVGAVPNNYEHFSPERYTSLHGFAQDLADILEVLDLEPCILVGHSMSGMAALLASIIAPKRIRRIVTIGSSPRYRNAEGYVGGFEQHELDAIFAAMETDYLGWAESFGPYAIGQADDPKDAEAFVRSLARLRPDIALSVARIAFQCDHRAELSSVTVPVDVIQSRQDIAVPVEAAAYLAKSLPCGSFTILDTAGHLPHMSVPTMLNSALLRCFSAAV